MESSFHMVTVFNSLKHLVQFVIMVLLDSYASPKCFWGQLACDQAGTTEQVSLDGEFHVTQLAIVRRYCLCHLLILEFAFFKKKEDLMNITLIHTAVSKENQLDKNDASKTEIISTEQDVRVDNEMAGHQQSSNKYLNNNNLLPLDLAF